MSYPNYATCKEMCDGHIKGCPHYEQHYKKLHLDVCTHYKLVNKHASHILNFTERDQKSLEDIAREAGV